MKTAILHGPRDFKVEDVKDPEVGPDGAIIQIKAFGVCGSELPRFEDGLPDDAVQESGIEALSRSMFGHEWSGEVAEVGANVTNIKPGDRVAAGGYGGFSEYIGIPWARGAIPLPDDMSYEVGAMIEPLGIGVAVAAKAEPEAGDTVVVLGAGTIGQGAWQVFKAMGASKVIVTELAERRIECAKALGADVVIDASKEDPVPIIDEITSGMGADIVVDAAGSPETFRQAFEIVRGGGLYQIQIKGATAIDGKPIDAMSPGGKIVMVGMYEEPITEWFPNVIFMKALRIVGSWGGMMREAFDLMVAGKVDTESLITHEFPLDDINEAFETQLRRSESVKVLVKP